MEHLPPVAQPYQPIHVPVVADREYDGLDFAGYPRRRGWDIDRLVKGETNVSPTGSTAAFFQTWLFFGLMHEILGVEIRMADFIRTDGSNKRWLTTEKLPNYLQAFRQQVERDKAAPESAEISQIRNNKIYKCFLLSSSIWYELGRLEVNGSTLNPMSPEIGLGIHVLAITLQTPWENGRSWMRLPNPFICTRMLSQGWCPSVVDQIQNSCNVLGQYYASLLGPPKRRLDHGNCSRDSKECIAKTMGADGYVVRHEEEGCQCKVLEVDGSKLADVIKNGEVPMLYLNPDDVDPTLEIVASKSEPGLEYTAISHVWSDGWGNPAENSLPLCRVKKLVRLISDTYSMPDFDVQTEQGNWQRLSMPKHGCRVLFWMDTLCVPRKPEEIYKESINKMREVYLNSERVLVLDAELMASTAECSYEEVNMRILCSTWIRRLWTIQEAVLATRLIFQFAERPHLVMSGSILWHAKQEDLKVNYYNSIGWDCTTSFEGYSFMQGFDRIPFIWKKLLPHRSVTFATDEPICGAILMDFNLEDLTRGEPNGRGDDEDIQNEIMSHRMGKFWSMHEDHVPVAVLFIQGPRLKKRGYSWAPSSFRMCSLAGPRISQMASTRPSGGLSAKFAAYSAFSISVPQHPTPSFIPCILGGQTYLIEKQKEKTNPSWDDLDLRGLDLAIILELEPVQADNGQRSFDASRAALVSVSHRVGETLHAEYLRLIVVLNKSGSFNKTRNVPWSAAQMNEAFRAPCQGSFFIAEQDWYFY